MKAIDSSPEYQRAKQSGKIRGKWRLLCGFIALPTAFLAMWICERLGLPKQIYLTVIPMIALVSVRLVGDSIADREIKRKLGAGPASTTIVANQTDPLPCSQGTWCEVFNHKQLIIRQNNPQ
jgi:hypothetical protein